MRDKVLQICRFTELELLASLSQQSTRRYQTSCQKDASFQTLAGVLRASAEKLQEIEIGPAAIVAIKVKAGASSQPFTDQKPARVI